MRRETLSEELLLVADIGGSMTRIGLATRDARLVWKKRVETPHTIIPLIREAVAHARDLGSVRLGVLGVAAPVRGGEAGLTNHPLRVRLDELEKAFPLMGWAMVNDLEGEAAYHAQLLREVDWDGLRAYEHIRVADAEVSCLSESCQPGRVWLIIKPGTGLGVSILKQEECILASELGHLPWEGDDVYPRGEWEDVLSIRGIHRLLMMSMPEGDVQDVEVFFSSREAYATGLRHEWLDRFARYLTLLNTLMVVDGFILAGRILRSIPPDDLAWLGRRVRLHGEGQGFSGASLLFIRAEYAGLKGLARLGARQLEEG